MNEVLTIQEVAALLSMTVAQVYSMTRKRARARMEKPIPVLKVNGNVRFLRTSVLEWLKSLEESR